MAARTSDSLAMARQTQQRLAKYGYNELDEEKTNPLQCTVFSWLRVVESGPAWFGPTPTPRF